MNLDSNLPVERRWTTLAQDREFPISGLASVAFHVLVLGLLLLGVFRMLFDRPAKMAIDIDPVVILDPPGAGNSGHDKTLAQGSPQAPEVTDTIEKRPLQLTSNVKDVAAVKPEVAPPKIDDDPNATEVAAKPKVEIPRLAPLLKGLPTGNSTKGDGGPGKAKGGIGQGTSGAGTGPDRAGTIRQERQLRWTMLFSTRNAADYLTQLKALGVMLGMQEQDKSIRMIRDLSRRPASAERGAAPPDRIFWMDDNPKSVAAMADELQLDFMPWRIVAYFPESIEQQLLQKELAYGKGFGRNSEHEIKETQFRIEFRAGQVRIAVVEQR